MVWCLSYHQPLLSSSIVLNQQEWSLRRKQVLFFLSSSSPPTLGKTPCQWQICNNPKIGMRIKTKASVLPPSESGDISILLLVSGVLISMYLVTNFLVPSLLFKSLQGDDDDEEEDDAD